MARVQFTANLRAHVQCPDEDIDGATLRAILDAYFTRHPAARSYVLDEHGAMRPHVVVFIGDTRAVDRADLSDSIPDGAEVWVMQALSGG